MLLVLISTFLRVSSPLRFIVMVFALLPKLGAQSFGWAIRVQLSTIGILMVQMDLTRY